jgi:hypothetical protein
MAVSAATAKFRRPGHRAASVNGDRLVPFTDAASRLGKTPETLRKWHDDGHLPAVTSPGGQWATFESFITAVLASPRPGLPGAIENIARAWFAERAAESA